LSKCADFEAAKLLQGLLWQRTTMSMQLHKIQDGGSKPETLKTWLGI
jgi:hypothetical protein